MYPQNTPLHRHLTGPGCRDLFSGSLPQPPDWFVSCHRELRGSSLPTAVSIQSRSCHHPSARSHVCGTERRRAGSVLALTRASSFSSQQVSLTSLHRGHTGHLSPIHAPSSGLSRKLFLPVCVSLTLNHSSAQGLLEKARCTLLTGSAPVLSHACFTCRDRVIFQHGSVSSSRL